MGVCIGCQTDWHVLWHDIEKAQVFEPALFAIGCGQHPIFLSHDNFNHYIILSCFKRNYTSVDLYTVNSHRCNALLNIVWILDIDMIYHISKTSRDLEITKACRYTRINAKSLMGRIDTKNVL